MESVQQIGRTLGDGLYRAAGLFARGARKIFASVPLVGGSAVLDNQDPVDKVPLVWIHRIDYLSSACFLTWRDVLQLFFY